MDDEEAIEHGKNLVEAYYRGAEYDESYAVGKREEVYRASGVWPKTVKALNEMGFTIVRNGGSLAGRTMAGDALLRTVEQLAENVKTTLDALEKSPTPNKKAITQWRHTLNALVGAPHKRGLLPDLKEAGPGSY